MRLATLCLALWLLTGGPSPVGQASSLPTPTSSVLLVLGAAGTEEYGEQFAVWAERWRVAAEQGGARYTVIGADSEASPAASASDSPPDTLAENDRERLRLALEQEAATSSGPLWLVLIGHGTFDGQSAKFNLRGPDVSAEDLASWLEPFDRPLAIINCTSASGPFLNKLSGENRVVITATKSGYEHNFARFGDYLSAAIVSPAADLDKDEQTSLLEAFLKASAEVTEFYTSDGRLVTEHALLDDNGDGLGTPADWFRGVRAVKVAKDGAARDGLLASQFHLVRSDREQLLTPELRARRDVFERDLERLRVQKPQLEEADYFEQLEATLVKLARLYEQAP